MPSSYQLPPKRAGRNTWYSPSSPTGIGAETIATLAPLVFAVGITAPATGRPPRSRRRPEYDTGTGTSRSTPGTVSPAAAATVVAADSSKTSPYQ